MSSYKKHFVEQIKLHLVALISLLTAIGGFTYNTWRDQINERHQNIRQASFEVLRDLSALQTIVNYAHYTQDTSSRGHPIAGWHHAINIRDLTRLLPSISMQDGEMLYQTWALEWSTLETSSESEHHISIQIERCRKHVLETIDNLP